MLLRRRLRKLYRQALHEYRNGQWFDKHPGIPAPANGSLRIAFDAGREAAADGRHGQWQGMSLDVWTQVLTHYLSC